ncbi:MAG TPA: pyridoxal phosphate-dependent aminotransferase [Acidobacteriaceae bacterium]|nr:pyridoxal phosphate-dependent aminotransferase [Acidobacteriaceae bacterium]
MDRLTRSKVKFSDRTQWDMAETPWARTVAGMRASGLPYFDLTASNPTHCELEYDAAAILGPLSAPQALEYDPNPRGSLPARQAVARYYARHGASLDPEHVLLTTSTSEGYSNLFRLLCNPGDEVLIAQPSYPLFDFLARLDDVRLSPYELFYDHGWHIDLDGLRRRVNSRPSGKTRAIAVVHPNNPTGHWTHAQDRAALEEICREHGLALIVDEVFLDYGISGKGRSFAAGEHEVLTFVLSGLSKIAALPQMKAAWIACFGEGSELAEALERLEVIADTFLSVNAPVQCALPEWLEGRNRMQEQIRARTGRNLARLDSLLKQQTMVSRVEVEAGWYAVLRVPALAEDEATALALLTEKRVAVHAGYFFGFPNAGWLVVSLLPEEGEFAAGVAALLSAFPL